MVKRGEIYWVELDPTVGSEIKKTRPCLIISPNDMNDALPRVIIAPITSKGQPLGSRPEVVIDGKKGLILLDQIRTVDKISLKAKISDVSQEHWHPVLMEMLS
jgi:mRNA interferase MazF